MSKFISETVIMQFIFLLIAITLYISTFHQNFTASADVAQSPMFFPRIILLLWIGLNLISLLQVIFSRQTLSPIDSWLRIILVVLATIIYVNLISSEGFFLTSVVFSLVCLPAFGIRNPIFIAVFAIAIPGALVLLFNHTLGMPLPISRFTHWF